VTDRDIAVPDFMKLFTGENVMHKPLVLVVRKHALVIHDNSAGFLTAVLKRIQAKVSLHRNIGGYIGINAENAALFVYRINHN
jgi:hypothetical protein